jgi:hypothetical protein
VTRHVPAGGSETERLTKEFDADPKGGLIKPLLFDADRIVSTVTGGITDRIGSFATDRMIDIGATLILMVLGVAITTVGVLRIFAAGADTKTGRAALGVASLAASAKTGGKF